MVWGSTGDKQTSKGLFICNSGFKAAFISELFFHLPLCGIRLRDERIYKNYLVIRTRRTYRQALISTSTPEGKSSLERASTVLEEEV
jgi:hypothetical protein